MDASGFGHMRDPHLVDMDPALGRRRENQPISGAKEAVAPGEYEPQVSFCLTVPQRMDHAFDENVERHVCGLYGRAPFPAPMRW